MITAEQVREIVMSADRWDKPMGNTGLTNTHLIIRDDGWQAIADELNATLGGGECECESSLLWDSYHGRDFYEHRLSCGHTVTSDWEEPPNFCEECGARVEGASERTERNE